jgi:hypothetical protein
MGELLSRRHTNGKDGADDGWLENDCLAELEPRLGQDGCSMGTLLATCKVPEDDV